MHIDDLSPILDRLGAPLRGCLAVGWLDPQHGFPLGETASEFRRKLRRLCDSPVRKARGFHRCPFCNDDTAVGTARSMSGGKVVRFLSRRP